MLPYAHCSPQCKPQSQRMPARLVAWVCGICTGGTLDGASLRDFKLSFQVDNIRKEFSSQNGSVVAIENINFLAGAEEFICIVGPSGCGKTTLLKIIAGLALPTSGSVNFLSALNPNQLRSAMVFQDLALFPWMNVLDNVAFGLEALGVDKAQRRTRALKFLDRLGLAGFAKNYPHELSGGMRQRAAILRAFLCEPQILLMDEPFGALDAQTRLVMQDELLRIWKEFKHTVVYVTHDIEEAILLGDRVLVMSGRPSNIRADIRVELPRPRHLTDQSHPEIADLRFQIWKMLEEEVHKEVGSINV